jgi:hypothetical protein
LHRKIADNERLSEQLDNIQSLHDVALAELRKHSTSTEGDLKALKVRFFAFQLTYLKMN